MWWCDDVLMWCEDGHAKLLGLGFGRAWNFKCYVTFCDASVLQNVRRTCQVSSWGSGKNWRLWLSPCWGYLTFLSIYIVVVQQSFTRVHVNFASHSLQLIHNCRISKARRTLKCGEMRHSSVMKWITGWLISLTSEWPYSGIHLSCPHASNQLWNYPRAINQSNRKSTALLLGAALSAQSNLS